MPPVNPAVPVTEKGHAMRRWYGIETHDRMIRQTLFVCPRCGLDRDGTEYEPRRWVTVVGMPIVPLEADEHVLSCNVCEHRCDLGVLDIPTTEVLAGYLADATRHGIASIVRAGMSASGHIEPAVRRVAVDTMLAEGFRYDDERLDSDAAGLDHAGTVAVRRIAEEFWSSVVMVVPNRRDDVVMTVVAPDVPSGDVLQPERSDDPTAWNVFGTTGVVPNKLVLRVDRRWIHVRRVRRRHIRLSEGVMDLAGLGLAGPHNGQRHKCGTSDEQCFHDAFPLSQAILIGLATGSLSLGY